MQIIHKNYYVDIFSSVFFNWYVKTIKNPEANTSAFGVFMVYCTLKGNSID